MNKTLISVIGPTAIGKTRISITIAKHFGSEIISADSRQFFKEMTIGTAVPNTEELQSAPHHFIQHKSINEQYSVGDFEKEGIAKLNELFKTNNITVMVGGSGLYVDAITNGLNDIPKVDSSIRQRLNQQLQDEGLLPLTNWLKELDSEYYAKVDLNNKQRVIRALEVSIGSGKPYSSFLNKPKATREFNVITIGLKAARPVIYDRINKRVDIMMSKGLLEEAKILHPFKELNALQTVGYKELFNYFEGEWTLEFAISEIKKNTRRFAKRQLTWFLKKEGVHWFNFDENDATIISKIEEQIKTTAI